MTDRPEGDSTTQAIDVVRDPASEARSYRLVVVEGASTPAELALDLGRPTRVLVGTSRACDLVVADRSVSRRHLALDLHAQGVKLVDLLSTNGTRVNGVRVLEALVEPGDRITCGATTLRVEEVATRADLTIPTSIGFGRVIGGSVAMRRLYPLCERLALSDLPVMIEGETGVGKELLAEAIHETGPRRAKPFVVLDCAGARGEAVVPLLFGEGSLLEQAHGGTLLLDEVAELADDAQARLIRFVDRSEVRRDGARVVEADVRLLATSRRDLDQAVERGAFREELFFRLAVSRVELPPLRDREGDVALLARAFWKALGAARGPLPEDLLERYEHYRWPGNVRELRNVVVRRLALGAFADLGREGAESASADAIEEVLALDLPLLEARARVIEQFERRYLARVLAAHGGNVSRAAAASGVARRYFQMLRARTGAG